MAHDVFISYPSENKPLADAICAKLESNGIRCWIAPRDILPGQKYAEALLNAIDNCKLFVLVFSQSTNGSPHIMSEVQRAFNNNRIIVPFRIENIEPSKALEYYIGNAHWLDAMTPPIESQIDTLVNVVKINLEAPIGRESNTVKRNTNTPYPILIQERSKLIYPAIIAILVVISIILFLNPLLSQGSRSNPSSGIVPTNVLSDIPTNVPITIIPTAIVTTTVPSPTPTATPTVYDITGTYTGIMKVNDGWTCAEFEESFEIIQTGNSLRGILTIRDCENDLSSRTISGSIIGTSLTIRQIEAGTTPCSAKITYSGDINPNDPRQIFLNPKVVGYWVDNGRCRDISKSIIYPFTVVKY